MCDCCLVILVLFMFLCSMLFSASASDVGSEKQFLKQLFHTIKEAVEKLTGWPDVSPVLIVDDLSILTSLGCQEHDVSVFFQDLQAMLCPYGGTIVSLIHTEHTEAHLESKTGSLYHHIGHQNDVIVLVRPLKTGYCRDLSGEVSFISSSVAFITYLQILITE